MQISIIFHPVPYITGKLPENSPLVTENTAVVGYIFPKDEVEILEGPKTFRYDGPKGQQKVQTLPSSIIILDKKTDASKLVPHISIDEFEDALVAKPKYMEACLLPIQERNAALWRSRSPNPQP